MCMWYKLCVNKTKFENVHVYVPGKCACYWNSQSQELLCAQSQLSAQRDDLLFNKTAWMEYALHCQVHVLCTA